MSADYERLVERIRPLLARGVELLPGDQEFADALAALDQLVLEHTRQEERLRWIHSNATSWHGDDEAKGRALNVIAAWASGSPLPASPPPVASGGDDA